MAYCKVCKEEIVEGSKFCVKCGKPMEAKENKDKKKSKSKQVGDSAKVCIDCEMKNSQIGLLVETSSKKKSKTPLIVGLSVGALLIMIISTIIVIILSGGNNGDNEYYQRGEFETTVLEDNTDESETVENEYIDYNDATIVAEKFMHALAYAHFGDISSMLYPGVIKYIEADYGYDIEYFFADMYITFSDPEYNFMQYEVKDACEYGGDFIKKVSDISKRLSDYEEYIEPEEFAEVKVEFTYESQSSYIELYLAYVEGEFYIVDFIVDNFSIEFETDLPVETLSNSEKEVAFKEYVAELSDAEKAHVYITIKSIPPTEFIHYQINSLLSQYTIEEIREKIIQSLIVGTNINKEECEAYVLSMDEEYLQQLISVIIEEEIKKVYAEQVEDDLGDLSIEQLASALELELENSSTEQCATYYDIMLGN